MYSLLCGEVQSFKFSSPRLDIFCNPDLVIYHTFFFKIKIYVYKLELDLNDSEPFPFSFGALMNFQLQGKEMKISLGEMHFSSFVYSFASLESILKHAFGLKNVQLSFSAESSLSSFDLLIDSCFWLQIDLSKTRNIEEVGIRGLLIMEHWFTRGKRS